MVLHGLSSLVSSALTLGDCVAALRGGGVLTERRWARRFDPHAVLVAQVEKLSPTAMGKAFAGLGKDF